MSLRLLQLLLLRRMLTVGFWLLVAVVAFLGWLSGYDVR